MCVPDSAPPKKGKWPKNERDEEVDVTCRVTFTTPQNVLNHNKITINNVIYTLDMEGDYKTP
jgi:hypothetical protein